MPAMVEVEHMTKRYAGKTAVDDVSFTVEQGEILGFLGLNGAGKTTTMRILSGYIPASEGRARVAGLDVNRDSMAVRRQIGYLPENVPLYNELRVDEYLRFRASIKGVGKSRRSEVQRVKALCGLEHEGSRIIGQLSKGYRQRVGLADALLHAPKLLILDEPTIGLDPHQIRAVRSLIKELATHHTVMLSSHILSEVEMTCRRVLIIHEGRIVASDTPANLRTLMQGGSRVVAEIHAPRKAAYEALASLPHVQRVTCDQREVWTRYEIACASEVDLRPNVFDVVAEHGWRLRDLRLLRSSLEDAFLKLTRSEPESGSGPDESATDRPEGGTT